ncbi:MAG: hypothetical protein KDA49_18300 [Rhodospirillaceae bacterium]|nr:hypothetical protein [Rhodospirillaceae bacterium]
MKLIGDILAELFGMFLGDARLSAAVLAVVGLAAICTDVLDLAPIIGGGVLLVGCLALVLESVRRAARGGAPR